MNDKLELKNFLNNYRINKTEEVFYFSLEKGFLQLKYEDNILWKVAFVTEKDDDAKTFGNELLLTIKDVPDAYDDHVVFMEDMGQSGVEWRDGVVRWGHTYEDEGGTEKGEKIELDVWIEKCVTEIIDPPLDKIKKYYES